MKRFGNWSALLASVVLAIGVNGCGVFTTEGPNLVEVNPEADGEAVGTQALNVTDTGNSLVNAEAGIEIILPESWSSRRDLHETAELQAADVDNELYLIVVAEDAAALRRFGIEENAENYRQLLIQRLSVYEDATATDVAFVGGDFAKQYEIRGRLEDGTRVIYLHTTVVSEDRYYQVVAWTTPEQYSFHRSELQEITKTFREIDA